MKNKVWEKAEQIFHAALDLRVEDRHLFLQRKCAGDAALFSEVESLLKNFERNADFLEKPVFELGLEAIGGKPQKNLSGSVIGNYQLREKIGSGGMGEVYKALDTRLNRYVALKFLCESLENDSAAKRRFVKEAQAVAMLEHPNICAVHGIEQSDEHHFIVMQFIEGKTLAENIVRQNITVGKFKSLAGQVITAVAFAHSHGVIHLDLKPGNIMLSGDGQIKVLDFGLAKVTAQKQISELRAEDVSHFSQNGLVIGTVSYMSPEQLRGERLDYRSDIFSVGIILYELISKQNPFARESQAEIIAAILSIEPTPLKKLAPDFPAILINLVEKCLQKNKEDRFQSAAELLVEFDRAESAVAGKIFSKYRQEHFVKVAFICLFLLAVWSGIFIYLTNPRQKTLAVLPIYFDNPPAEKEYLADDLTQSIVDKLSKLPDLKVKNAFFAERYKGKNIELQAAGKQLNADTVFSGIIQNRAEGLFLQTRIIRTSDNVLIDANESKIDETRLVGLPEDIAARIADKIQSNLTKEDKTKLAKKETESNEAKNFYLQGRFFLKKRKDGDSLEKAIEAFTNAKDIDQNYARAWAGLADAYLSQSAPGVKRAIMPERAVELAKLATNKAIALDNTLSDTYNSLGLISLRYDWNWKQAENYFRTAIERDSEFLPARFGLINVLKMQERYGEALEETKKIKEIDPLSVAADIQIALIYYRKRDYRQANEILSELLQRFPDDLRVKYVMVYQLLKTDRFKEATEIIEPIYKSSSEEDKVLAAAPLGFAYAKTGRGAEALKIIEELKTFRKIKYVPAQEKALIYVGLGDYDKVFENLNLSCAEKFSSLPGWINDPIVDEVKNDSRFAEIRKCANL